MQCGKIYQQSFGGQRCTKNVNHLLYVSNVKTLAEALIKLYEIKKLEKEYNQQIVTQVIEITLAALKVT